MYKINDYVVHINDVCKIIDIKKNKINNVKYYVMKPIDDDSLIINAPTDNRMSYIRSIISSEEAHKLIDSIPDIKIIDGFIEKNLENIYKDLLIKGSHSELIQIIKTSYLRNDERIKNNKKISDKDDKYFKLAEKYLYNELSIALNMPFQKTKTYIIDRVRKLIK